ncbi:N-6 DNA methylase [Nocardioides speluncae]|uniref:N-6 DNA methylase n=1 Tax=Nocardioides speluncae TaxID=2670337 RepID=UPI000D68D55B|nr:N-6 DNA methylase [Nocardioides speluncae]
MLPGDSAELRKARGAYFTPTPVARFIAEWAVRSLGDDVLEPSSGEAVFLHEVGRHGKHKGRLVGVELHAASAAKSEHTLKAEGIKAEIHAGDFFLHDQFGSYDVVIGNPPYVRYQGWSGETRTRSRTAALRAGVNLTRLAASWAAFTIHSALHLRAGGRLGLVLPAELLSVNYAAPVRQFLLDHFANITLVLFEQRVFPGVDVEAVLLLADGYTPAGERGAEHMNLFQVHNADGLEDLSVARKWTPPSKSAKWSAGMLSRDGLSAYTHAIGHDGFTTLNAWGATTLGMVTGNNKYFTLSPSKVDELKLEPSDIVQLSPPGSRHLRTLTLTQESLTYLGEAGRSTYLFRPTDEPSAAAWRYIRGGENLEIHRAYKCRVRSPWWRVPMVRPADLLLTYMNADTPRLCTNYAGAHHLNSVHGVYLRDDVRRDGMDLLPIASLNSITLLGAETVGRAYGGGMLKIEPKEADHLPMPSPALVREHRDALRDLRPEVAAALHSGRLLEAVALVDELILVRGIGMGSKPIAVVRRDHAQLAARRAARAKGN